MLHLRHFELRSDECGHRQPQQVSMTLESDVYDTESESDLGQYGWV